MSETEESYESEFKAKGVDKCERGVEEAGKERQREIDKEPYT
jgi:hypothetical protein